MELIEKDFKLEYDEGCNKFDLYLMHVVNAKDPEKRREEFKLRGYSMSLDSALSVVINRRLCKKENINSLKTYLDEFKKEKIAFKNLLNVDVNITQ